MKHSIIINDKHKQKRKHSLEDNGYTTKSKQRRHLSPQNANKTITPHKSDKTKSTKRSILNNSAGSLETSRQTSRRHSYSIKHLNQITLPNWDRISPNIDQVLSSKHTQSGVFAHEIHLVQQELEALLSMSILRANLLHPTDTDLKIRQHQQVEQIYSAKSVPNKPLASLINQRHVLLDRQVSLTPIIGARIDQIWSDINTYYRQISSNDILTIENLVKFNQRLEEKIEEYKDDYNTNTISQFKIVEQLNKENFQDLLNITKVNPLITHYIDRTTIGRFQTKLYEHMSCTSPVYKTPISSPLYGKLFGNGVDHGSSVRISPRLHRNNRIDLFSVPDLKPSRNKTNMTPNNLPSTMKFQQRIQLVRDYVTDQHLLNNGNVKRQLFNELKGHKKRKSSIIINNDHCTDIFQSKLSTLISLLHECSSLSLNALKRARLQLDNEQTWQKLNTIEHDLILLIEKVDLTGDFSKNMNTEKKCQTLSQLLNDWKENEDEYNKQYQQLEQLFIGDD